ncbi:hypothetical protein PITC_043910 [Penicillium italicum]|uniref:Zn(2)-C6 fungal-type domain-containing protein n=1 Tax=Penicillium italicum TaxID=40296 RepID=A0A0A2LE18_PENIT|nr:hypothetical protein PITC_043910 [Penicillium italicum]
MKCLFRNTRGLVDSSSIPRAKVHPANRLQVNTACAACRASRKCCSSYFPGANCIHEVRGHSCTPFKSLPNVGHRIPLMPASQPTADLKTPLGSQPHGIITPHLEFDRLEAGSHLTEVTHRTHPRMLRNLQGERVLECCDCDAHQLIGTNSLRRKSRLSVISTITSGYSGPTYRPFTVFSYWGE